MRHRTLGGLFGIVVAIAVAAIASTRGAVADAATSQTGCMNQWLFNGLWRAEVTKIAPHMDGATQTGWEVTEVWRNGATRELSPGDSQLVNQELELNTGSILATATMGGGLSMNAVAFHEFAPAAEFTYTQVFVAQNVDPNNKPKAVDVMFDGAKLAAFTRQPQFTTHRYNYHFNLGCVATGAAAQAQGGSTQIAAFEGCSNQWLSNGVWKMRATGVAPDNNNDPSSPQIGWLVTEDWVNLTGKTVAPWDTFTTDQYLITAGGSNVASSNGVSTGLTMQKLTMHEFASGEKFTYQQNFRWAGFSAGDKPTRLLVTFDAVSQNKRVNGPHFKMPGNFRINFECSK